VTLREQRILFTRLVCEFGVWVFSLPGYEIAFGEVKRSKLQAQANASNGTGINNSLHLEGLAVDQTANRIMSLVNIGKPCTC